MPFGTERSASDRRRIEFNDWVAASKQVHCHRVWACITLCARAPSNIVETKESGNVDHMSNLLRRVAPVKHCREKGQCLRYPLAKVLLSVHAAD